MEIGTYGYIIIAIIVAGVLMETIKGRCPKCKRYRAMRRTGKDRDMRWWSPNYSEERLCRYCGHRKWTSESDTNVGR